MPSLRRTRAAVAGVAASLVVAALPAPATAAYAATSGLSMWVSNGCSRLIRGKTAQPVELTVENGTDADVDATLVTDSSPGITVASVTPEVALLPARSTRVFLVTVDVAPDVPGGQQARLAFSLDVGGQIVPALGGPDVLVIGRPDAPADVTATAGDNSATVAWTPGSSNLPPRSADDPATPPQHLIVASPGGATAVATDGATSAVVRGLTNGTAYTFTVVAHTNWGDSAPTAPSAPVVPAGVPRPVTSVGAAGSGTTRVVSWAPADGNGAPVTGYTVTASPGGATTEAPPDATSVEVTGVTGDTVFTVRARNAVGDGHDSVATDGTPGAPGSFEGTVATTTYEDWQYPLIGVRATLSDDTAGDVPITGYEIDVTGWTATRDVPRGEPWVRSLVGESVYPGATASVRVRALNAAGAGPWSAPTTPLATGRRPFGPRNVHLVPGDGSVYVCFSPEAAIGSVGLVHTVTLRSGAFPEPSWDLAPGDDEGTWLTGLENGVPHRFALVSANTYGATERGWTDFADGDTVTPSGPPAGLAGVTVAPGDGSAVVSWDPARDANHVEVVASPGGARTLVRGDATSAVVPGLTNGTAYTFRVRASGVHGPGPATETGAVTPAGVPAKVGTVAAAAGAGRSVTLTWPPADPNGSPVTGYTVTASPGGATVEVAGTSAEVTLPSYNTAYTYTVVATNAAGTGVPSDPTAPQGVYDAAAPVVTVPAPAAFTTTGTATVRYAATDAASGVASYDVRYRVARYDGAFGAYRYPAAWQGRTAASASVGTVRGWTYCFSVRARDAAGNVSAWSPGRCTSAPVDDRALTASRGWSRGTSTAYLGGTYTATVTRGARLTTSVHGVGALAVVGTRCAGCGTVEVYVGGIRVGAVRFAAASTRHRYQRVITLPRRMSGTVTLVASGRVYIDALGASRD